MWQQISCSVDVENGAGFICHKSAGIDDRLVLSHSSWNNNNNNNTDNAAASHTVRAEIFGSGEFGISDQGIGDVYNLHH